jgi:hypothetical protein
MMAFKKSWIWTAAFAVTILVCWLVRFPFLPDGHQDEVHTIGRALNIIYTGDLNPHFFNHPTGTMYFCVPWDIMAIASISREVGGNTKNGDLSAIETFLTKYPQPISTSLFNSPKVSPHWDSFRYKVRTYNMMLIPLQMLLLAYIGWRLNMLAPALGASLLLTFCDANIRDSVYVSVNSTTGFLAALSMASIAFLIHCPPVQTLRQWLLRLSVISFIVGLAVACKYNAGTFLILPIMYGYFSMRQLPNGTKFGVEKMLIALPVIWIAMSIGFTMLCPYWYKELRIFIQQVLVQVWYFKTGHDPYNTFAPGWEMASVYIRCLAEQYSWLGLISSVICMGYITYCGFWTDERFKNETTFLLPVLVACLAFLALMTNQAVFFSRNLSIMWSGWFLLTCTAWWYAPRLFAERMGWQKPEKIQTIFFASILTLSIIKAALIDPNIFKREWWHLGDATIIALKYWF